MRIELQNKFLINVLTFQLKNSLPHFNIQNLNTFNYSWNQFKVRSVELDDIKIIYNIVRGFLRKVSFKKGGVRFGNKINRILRIKDSKDCFLRLSNERFVESKAFSFIRRLIHRFLCIFSTLDTCT